jgi:hypothetical protein
LSRKKWSEQRHDQDRKTHRQNAQSRVMMGAAAVVSFKNFSGTSNLLGISQRGFAVGVGGGRGHDK